MYKHIFHRRKRKITFISTKGFTLIELLVVIAVIGLLAGVILASLNSARSKGADAAIVADLNTIRTIAALEYDNLGGSYTNVGIMNSGFPACNVATSGAISQNTQYQAAMANILNLNGAAPTSCIIYPTAYSIAVTLKTSGKFWCIDSTGRSTGTTLSGVPYGYLAGGPGGAQDSGTDTTCN